MSLSKQALCLADPQSDRAASTNYRSCFLGGDDAVLHKLSGCQCTTGTEISLFLQHVMCL